MRIGLGLDPYKGEKLEWKERANEAKMFAIFNFSGKVIKLTNNSTNNLISEKTINLIGKHIEYVGKANGIYQGSQTEFKNK